MVKTILSLSLVTLLSIFSCGECRSLFNSFPPDFMFGVSTASYQIEGAWNESGKGENIWDRRTHENPSVIYDKSTGDEACNSYHLYKRDIQMLKELGVHHYRFSLSWSRILPNGYADVVSEAGIKYYNSLIDGLLAADIVPVVTMYHWDLPQPLQDIGGWPNRDLVNYFEDYARIVFKNFGDRVKYWITFNEPKQVCQKGYGSTDGAPGINSSGIADYMCAHTLLLSHARAYHLYNDTFRNTQNGKIGITIDTSWMEPASSLQRDIDAAERALQFGFGIYANPIFSKEGDYPKIMREIVDRKSKEQGFPRSRLPTFTPEEKDSLIGSADFFGLNHYTTYLVIDERTSSIARPLYDDDMGCYTFQDPRWIGSASSWLKIVPWGFRSLLNKIRKDYNNPLLIVTENGYSTKGGLHDELRIQYITEYLKALEEAILDGCNIRGYTHWSLMDNFEWMRGYSEKFGLYEVDYDSPNKTRTLRDSGYYYASLICYVRAAAKRNKNEVPEIDFNVIAVH